MRNTFRRRTAARYGLVTATAAGLTGPKALVEAAALAREALEGLAYDQDRLRILNAHAREECTRLAEVLVRRAADVVHQRRPATATRRPARRRKTNRATAVRASPDPERPRKRCRGCGVEFTPSAPQQRYHSPDCSNADRQRRFKDRHRKTAVDTDPILERYKLEVEKACRGEILSATEALELLISPSKRVLKRLAAEAVVA